MLTKRTMNTGVQVEVVSEPLTRISMPLSLMIVPALAPGRAKGDFVDLVHRNTNETRTHANKTDNISTSNKQQARVLLSRCISVASHPSGLRYLAVSKVGRL